MKIQLVSDLVKQKYLSLSLCSALAVAMSACEKSGGSASQDQSHSDDQAHATECWKGAVRMFDHEVDQVTNAQPMQMFPALKKDGKMQMVSVKEYIAAKIKGKKEKYYAVSVPDG